MGWTKQKHKVPRDIAGKQWESVGKPPVHGPDCSAAYDPESGGIRHYNDISWGYYPLVI